MGAPVAIGIAAARSRTGRRVTTALLLTLLLATGAALSPLFLVSLAAANATTSAPDPAPGGPRVVGDWGYPLAPGYMRGRGFGYHPVEGCAYCPPQHYGADLSSECGADVFAAGPGRVVFAKYYGQFGNTVLIDHGSGVLTLYGHLATGSFTVAQGQPVTAGTRIGAEGQTGVSYGCHLHFEVRINNVRSDPDPFMNDLGLPL